MTSRFVPALTLALVMGCGSAGAEKGAADLTPPTLTDAPSARVEVATVSLIPAVRRLEMPGEVKASADANLAAPLGGFVEDVLVKEGQSVRRGQLLARVDVASREAQLRVAEAQAAQAKAELDRAIALADGLSGQARLNVETQAKIAEANVELARINLRRAMIVAPFAGKIAKVNVEEGEVVAPGAPAMRLVAVDPALIELSVSDIDVAQLEEGQAVRFTSLASPLVVDGVVQRRGVAADLGTRTWTVEVAVPNADGALMPGMLGRVSLERTLSASGVLIPQDWIVTRASSRGVFLLGEDDVARWRDLEIEAFLTDQALIRSGLNEGDVVVSAGHRELAEGDALYVVRRGVCCEAGRVKY
jgi:RND family efflux transporter MFP subunit